VPAQSWLNLRFPSDTINPVHLAEKNEWVCAD